ncbi:MAG: ComEC/Rec2 family competence protein, partial [Micromonosporaceae bacterium]
LGVVATLASAVWPPGAAFVAWVAHWPAWWLVLVARWGAGMPGGTAPWPGGTAGGLLLAGALALLLVVIRRRRARQLIAVAAVAAVVGAAGVRTATASWPPPGWTFVACDVGQGDALVVRTGGGQAIVVDTGPEPSAVDRCLRRLGVVSIPLLVISHYHADHIGGTAGAIRHRDVAAVAGPTFAEPESGHATVTRAATDAGAEMLAVSPGWRYEAGQVHLEVLGPDRTEAGTRSDPNNNSVILRVNVAGISLLLAGDAEVERQQALLAAGAPVQADVLKVAHHGSAYQDPDFLDAVDPAVAIVSVGADNDYGHPNRSLLRRLTIDGARVFRTDRGGDIAVSRTAGGLAVTSGGRAPGDGPT